MHPETDPKLYQQATDIALIVALAEQVRSRTFVDVGAEKGSFAEVMFGMGFSGTLFEPFPAHHAGLNAMVGAHPGSRLMTCAVDDRDHEGTLHIATGENGEALDFFHSLQRLEDRREVKHSKELRIPCRSLESLANEGVIPREIGVLKIDTEGNDFNVIKGMGGGVRAEVLICEFVTPKLYGEWKSAFPDSLIGAAREKGFQECAVVKRHGALEFVALKPGGFIDGEWGNLIFASTELFKRAKTKLEAITVDSQQRLFSTIQTAREAQQEAQHIAKLEAEKRAALNEKLEAAKAKIAELKAKKKPAPPEGWIQRKLRKLGA